MEEDRLWSRARRTTEDGVRGLTEGSFLIAPIFQREEQKKIGEVVWIEEKGVTEGLAWIEEKAFRCKDGQLKEHFFSLNKELSFPKR